jgi:hypothetical protein
MSPRIIHIPLSGGDRKAQAKDIRYAHGIYEPAAAHIEVVSDFAVATNPHFGRSSIGKHLWELLKVLPARGGIVRKLVDFQ